MEAAKRTIRDSLFSDLFGNKKYLLQLYKTLHPEDTRSTEDDLTDVTIQAVQETIRICKDKDVLREYLSAHEKEVVSIMMALFDQEKTVEQFSVTASICAMRRIPYRQDRHGGSFGSLLLFCPRADVAFCLWFLWMTKIHPFFRNSTKYPSKNAIRKKSRDHPHPVFFS